MAPITLEHITKRYPDGFEAVKDFNLTVEDGEFMILVGPSGCGKSTALRMVAGLEDISDGELKIGDELVNDRAPKDRDIAMVFQNYALYPHMSVRENMGFALKLAKVPAEEIDRKVRDVAKILDLEQHLDRKPANLSGGQRQRVAMGRAIVRDPKAFLMDEPLSNLDAKLRVQMRTEIARLQSQLGTTMIYVTHDQTEALTLGDRIAVMRAGLLQQVGPPQELYEHPVNLFVAGFIGSPAMNFLPGRLEERVVHTALGDIPLADECRRVLESSGDPMPTNVIVGMRPEHFEDARLVGETWRGATFDVTPAVIESMGSESYMYFDVEAERVAARELEELAQDAGAGEMPHAGSRTQMVARLNASSQARHGEPMKLWFDAARMHLFDPEGGRNLLLGPRREEAAPAPAGARSEGHDGTDGGPAQRPAAV